MKDDPVFGTQRWAPTLDEERWENAYKDLKRRFDILSEKYNILNELCESYQTKAKKYDERVKVVIDDNEK